MSRDIIKLDQIDVTFHQKKRTITAVKILLLASFAAAAASFAALAALRWPTMIWLMERL